MPMRLNQLWVILEFHFLATLGRLSELSARASQTLDAWRREIRWRTMVEAAERCEAAWAMPDDPSSNTVDKIIDDAGAALDQQFRELVAA